MKDFLFCFVLVFISTTNSMAQQMEIQGHRGARGLRPENTIAGFKKALDLGVHTLELDVVITKDEKVLISHDPYLSSEICLDENGGEISKENEQSYNLYEMDYEQIKQFDCGSKGNTNFPEQVKQLLSKPLLQDMIFEIEAYAKNNNLNLPGYNIELKSMPDGDGIFHPEPQHFSELVFEVIDRLLPRERITIQSFDKRILQDWNKNFPDYKLAFLVEDYLSPEELEKLLGFKAAIFSPFYKVITEQHVREYHKDGYRVIPWTINDIAEMEKLKGWKVDGLITDYPDRAKAVMGYR